MIIVNFDFDQFLDACAAFVLTVSVARGIVDDNNSTDGHSNTWGLARQATEAGKGFFMVLAR